MNTSNLIHKEPFYKSWIALVVFVFFLIFQPPRMTFYAMRPSDGWLLLCLFLQYIHGNNLVIPFKNRNFIKNYGLIIGIFAIVATLMQASYAGLSLKISFVFEFYRFLRFLLIFKLVENTMYNLSKEDAVKFWRAYTMIGIFIILLSFLEYFGIQPYKLIIMNLYYERPETELEDYLILVDRLAGVMGNPNTTAILLVSTLPYPLLRIANRETTLIRKIIHAAYVIISMYVFFVMTGSRTSIFILIILFAIVLFVTVGRLKEFVAFTILSFLLIMIGFYIIPKFKSEIVLQDRVTKALSGEDFDTSAKGFGKWVGRYELWQDRFQTFNKEGNPIAVFVGLGYTKAYKDYSDNGFISAFVNNGLLGLILKLYLFYIFLGIGLFGTIQNYRNLRIDYSFLCFALSVFSLMIWELTADLTEHYKLGQLFYLFISIILSVNGRLSLLEDKSNFSITN